YTIYSSPLLADLDLDGHLELLVGCNDTKVYAWDLGAATYDPELMPWPQYRNGPKRNARVDRPAYAQIIPPPLHLVPGATINLPVVTHNPPAQSQQFQCWLRAWSTTGGGLVGSSATPMDLKSINLPAGIGQTVSTTVAFRLPCDPSLPVDADYNAQVYLGQVGANAFDVTYVGLHIFPGNPADVTCDARVNIDDLLAVIGA